MPLESLSFFCATDFFRAVRPIIAGLSKASSKTAEANPYSPSRQCIDMSKQSETQKDLTFESVFLQAAKTGVNLRLYGNQMCIIAEGQVAFAGKGIVGLRHRKDKDPDEFVKIDSIVKVQELPESRY